MANALERRFWGAAIVIGAAVVSSLAVRRFVKPTAEAGPDFRQKGEAASPIVITEFSDFECPACKAAEPGVKNLLALYGPQTRFIFKQFPLPARVHPWARPAAITAECAGRQGKFWPAHDLFYDHQAQWSESKDPAEDLVKLAVEGGADETALRQCIKDPSAAAAVDADVKEGQDRWVNSTPTFFINQRRFAGSLQFATRGTLWIEKILKK
jgi:protein-disulfide isomerase